MKTFVNKLLMLLSCCTLIFIYNPISVYAETDEDLLEIYGKSSNSIIRQEIINQISDVNMNIQSVERTKELNERYNRIIDKYNEEQWKQYARISNTVDEYLLDNNSIKEEFKDNLSDISITDLKKLDARYKANISKANELVEQLDTVYISTDYKNTDFDLTDLYSAMDELSIQYNEAVDATEIGDVKNIHWIANNEYYVTSKFGYRVDPISGAKIQYHAGSDFRCPANTEVGALFDGVVIDTGFAASSGNYVTVQSGDRIKYYYCHLNDVLVSKGDKVNQYDIIALSGNTGYRSTGPHLHIALYINGVAYDPTQLFEN